MQFVTALGYQEFLMILIAFLIFGIHFKKGFILIQILLWTAVFTFFFKQYFALPRPFHVDSSLKLLDYVNHGHGDIPFFKRGAVTFFGLPPFDVISYYRNLGEFSYGFPSGHTSVAVSVWGALAILFRRKWITYLSIALIFLIPFSRIYLGVHFIADVLGGYLLGGAILWAFYQLILKPSKLQPFLKKNSYVMDFKMAIFIFSPLLLIPFLHQSAAVIPAFMFGFNLVFYWLSRESLPINTGNWQSIVGGTLLFLFIFGGMAEAIKFLAASSSLEVSKMLNFLRYFVSVSVGIWLTTTLSYKFKWLEKSENNMM
ncbi:MAG: phosphatase PAP2 family protein [Chitinophagales bacterium]